MGQRIVFIRESPFTRNETRRFGVRELTRAGYVVELWEVASLFQPRSLDLFADRPKDIRTRQFLTMDEFQDAIGELEATDTVIVLCGVYWFQGKSHRALQVALSASRARLVTVTHGHVPELPESDPTGLKLRMRHIVVAQRWRFRRIIASSRIRNVLRRVFLSLRTFDLILAGTSVEIVDKSLVSKRTRIHFIHNFDFDEVLRVQPNSRVSKATCVLIDHMGFHHPDLHIQGIDVSQYDETRYFEAVRDFLTTLELKSGLSVVIAAHPAAEPGSLDSLYGHRKVLHGRTAEAVAESSLVILMNASAATNFAVAFRKPIAVLHSMFFRPETMIQTRALADILDLAVLCIDDTPTCLPQFVVNESAYKKYEETFLKRPGTDSGYFWDAALPLLKNTPELEL